MDNSGRVRIGTSGWVYKHWLDIFYPRRLPGSEQLPFYARHYDTVEINFSFYRLPERTVFEQWRTQTPEGFLFAVKGSRYLTHMKKLKDPEEPLSRLMDRAWGLEDKLGPILFQFPHTWHANLDRLQGFLQALEPYAGQRFAFEFRHSSWLVPAVFTMLEEARVALCLPVDPGLPLHHRLTADWTYIRMHRGAWGTEYSDEELATWADRIRTFRQDRVDTHLYFNNDPEGHALRDADRIIQMLQT